GSTMEHVGFDGRVTDAGVREIVAAAQRLLPHLPAVPTRTWAGLRPITPDGRPIVGPDPDVRGLWYATGHGRNGVLLAGLPGTIASSASRPLRAPRVTAASPPPRSKSR